MISRLAVSVRALPGLYLHGIYSTLCDRGRGLPDMNALYIGKDIQLVEDLIPHLRRERLMNQLLQQTAWENVHMINYMCCRQYEM